MVEVAVVIVEGKDRNYQIEQDLLRGTEMMTGLFGGNVYFLKYYSQEEINM